MNAILVPIRLQPAFAWIIGVASLLIASEARTQVLAFPGAEGFGRYATGGRNGTVYHVTNTNDSGAGSLRTGATTPNCTIVFDVSGVIRINSLIHVAPNVTITYGLRYSLTRRFAMMPTSAFTTLCLRSLTKLQPQGKASKTTKASKATKAKKRHSRN